MKKKPEILTQKRLHELLHYDVGTGIFTNRITRSSNAIIGFEAGYTKPTGYIVICIDNRIYRANRLAYLYVEGYFPEFVVDHKNRIKTDNSWSNLRHASHQCNVRNNSLQKNNTSKVKGVSFNKNSQKWRAHMEVNGVKIPFKRRKYKHTAVIDRWEAEVKYNFNTCNTSSSAYMFLKERALICT
ncbi:MAG: hypothetical protein GY714_18355 [Desulfobacterales bacterium]|nr:hypothetical protein [Desulfobacterales bacterium]